MFLFKVDNTFLITGVGLILTPGFGDKNVELGSPVRLIRPDRSIVETKITCIVFGAHHFSVEASSGNL
jgi:hypothetical protein